MNRHSIRVSVTLAFLAGLACTSSDNSIREDVPSRKTAAYHSNREDVRSRRTDAYNSKHDAAQVIDLIRDLELACQNVNQSEENVRECLAKAKALQDALGAYLAKFEMPISRGDGDTSARIRSGSEQLDRFIGALEFSVETFEFDEEEGLEQARLTVDALFYPIQQMKISIETKETYRKQREE